MKKDQCTFCGHLSGYATNCRAPDEKKFKVLSGLGVYEYIGISNSSTHKLRIAANHLEQAARALDRGGNITDHDVYSRLEEAESIVKTLREYSAELTRDSDAVR